VPPSSVKRARTSKGARMMMMRAWLPCCTLSRRPSRSGCCV
jgi:hypothetical protein